MEILEVRLKRIFGGDERKIMSVSDFGNFIGLTQFCIIFRESFDLFRIKW